MTSNKNTRTDNAEWEKSDTRRSTLCDYLRQMTETIHRRPGVGPDSRNLRGLLGCPPWQWHGCTWVWARVRAGVHLCVGAWVHGLHVYMRGCACVGAQVCGPPLYVCVWVWGRCRCVWRECGCEAGAGVNVSVCVRVCGYTGMVGVHGCEYTCVWVWGRCRSVGGVWEGVGASWVWVWRGVRGCGELVRACVKTPPVAYSGCVHLDAC